MGKRGPRKFTEEDRIAAFWRKVDKESSPHGCWLWTGAKCNKGYGRILIDKAHHEWCSTHRFSLQLYLGRKLIGDECALHNCPGGDNPLCVNPAHLWVGTRADNNDDTMQKGRWRGWTIHRGSSNKAAKLTEAVIAEIRSRIGNGRRGTQRQLAKEYGVSESLICMIKKGVVWKHTLQEP